LALLLSASSFQEAEIKKGKCQNILTTYSHMKECILFYNYETTDSKSPEQAIGMGTTT
jgi:lipocalin